MGATTITYYKCDGNNCGKVLSDPNAGIVLHGYITAVGEVDNNKGLLAGTNRNTFTGGSISTAYCWKCFQALVPNPLLEEARREASRSTYRDTYHDNDDYDPYPRTGTKGPTGPLAPPDLPSVAPHYVTVAANLSGVRRE